MLNLKLLVALLFYATIKQKEDGYVTDLLIIKTDKQGNLIWEKVYGTEKAENGLDGVECSNGDLLVLGMESSKQKGDDILLLRYNSKGDLIWMKRYGGNNNESPKQIILTKDEHILITGTQEILNPTGQMILNGFLMKLDVEGNQLWNKTYATTVPDDRRDDQFNEEGEGANTLMQTLDGGYLIGGYSMTQAKKEIATDGWICKVDANGKELWHQTFGAIGGDDIRQIQEDEAGNLYVTGTRYNKTPVFKVSLWLLKFDPNGKLLYENYFNDGNVCIGGKSAKIDQEKILIIGSSNNTEKEWLKLDEISPSEKENLLKKGWEVTTFNQTEYLENDNSKTGIKKINEDNYLVLANLKGEKLWEHSYGGDKDERLMSVCQSKSGSIYLTGFTYSKGNGLKDIVLVKLK